MKFPRLREKGRDRSTESYFRLESFSLSSSVERGEQGERGAYVQKVTLLRKNRFFDKNS